MLHNKALYIGIVFTFLITQGAAAQGRLPIDSIQPLPEVAVRGYLSQQPLLQTPASVGLLRTEVLNRHTDLSPLPAFNLVPGVRMEERSPGSYRLSIRGSLLRSPFGVRNVKVYLDDIPLTDASGNTYLNLLDAKAIERAEVLKGPDGSLFGANSGGVVLLDARGRQQGPNSTTVDLNGGAYGLFHESLGLKYGSKKSSFSLNQGYLRSDGYRQNTALQRHYVQAAERFFYGKNNSIKAMAFYTDLQYRTPGGLTQAQYEADPRQARPAAGPNPGAVEQKAGVFNRTFWGGLTNELYITDHIRYVLTVFGSKTDFENPFITNYEFRAEQNTGTRTYVSVYGQRGKQWAWKWDTGREGQRGQQTITNFSNEGGTPQADLSQDKLNIRQAFYFSRVSATIAQRWHTELALSLNTYYYGYKSGLLQRDRTLPAQWMPRLATSYLATPELAFRATLSRGYSPPTLAEVRPSYYSFNTELEPESGWNKEIGFRWSAWNNRLQVDASVFRYDLEQAIVRRSDQFGTEFFVNAGGTRQTGIESAVQVWLLVPKNSGTIRGLQLSGSHTFSHFVFNNYQDAAADYTGNRLTGVPRNVLVWDMLVRFPQGLSLSVTANSTSKLPLNDANTAYADGYNLLQARLTWGQPDTKRRGIAVFVGGDNLLNEKYSLGNDLNAFGGRYFNAAAPLNLYGGLRVKI